MGRTTSSQDQTLALRKERRTSPKQTISDQQRQDTEQQLATALLLLYAGHRQRALAALGVNAAIEDLPPEAIQKVQAFAADRAQKIQDGVNSRMLGADDPQAMLAEMAQYNADTLQPYMESWASHQGLLDAYQETPGQNGGTAAEDGLWIWQQVTDFPDDCTEADSMSPAPLGEIQAVAGVDAPPAHENCRCSLNPA